MNNTRKEVTLQNIEKSNSKYYRSNRLAHAVASDILTGLTDEEIKQLYNMGKDNLKINVGFTLWDVIKTAFGK